MRTCPRNAFLPEAHRNPEEAFVDSPVRLDALDFNVSAPHMHATCLVRIFPTAAGNVPQSTAHLSTPAVPKCSL